MGMTDVQKRASTIVCQLIRIALVVRNTRPYNRDGLEKVRTPLESQSLISCLRRAERRRLQIARHAKWTMQDAWRQKHWSPHTCREAREHAPCQNTAWQIPRRTCG